MTILVPKQADETTTMTPKDAPHRNWKIKSLVLLLDDDDDDDSDKVW